jgi:hypothetical protein
MLNLNGFIKAEKPIEGEIREYKDGSYKFIAGHWKKIKPQEEVQPTSLADLGKEVNKTKFLINDKVNFKYDNKVYKAKVIEDLGNLVRIEMIDEIEIEDKDKAIHRIKPGYRFNVGKKTLDVN